jgi:molybdenum cofactor sulfurtransferase
MSSLELEVSRLRAKEFSRLQGMTYLDWAGAALYTESHIHQSSQILQSTLFGNTHSDGSPSSVACSAMVDNARDLVLRWFDTTANDYLVVFTSGATGALKLVGENFDWAAAPFFAYTLDNHNSVLGIREYASERGATWCVVDGETGLRCCCTEPHAWLPHSPSTNKLANPELQPAEEPMRGLFAFPAESNFSGARYDLGWVSAAQQVMRRYFREIEIHTYPGPAASGPATPPSSASQSNPPDSGNWK